MKIDKEIAIISGFMGFAIGVCVMMVVQLNKNLNHKIILQEIEYSVCEECWYDVFDCGNNYQN